MTELYDQDHNVTVMDRARAEALRNARQHDHGPLSSILNLTTQNANDSSSPEAEMMRQFQEQLSQLLQNFGDLSAEDTGTPTAKKFLDSLEKFFPSPEDIEEEMECPVCMMKFTEEDHMNELPCQHVFHPQCCTPWLLKNNTCPVCRHELPTGDETEEDVQARKAREADREQQLQHLHNSMFG
eukprot:m.118159 g.118159  ORF g.118159 m.118159 type:complete len:183 (+) comp17198_c0_seq7:140-688(+)